jgi:hypothetical protein
MKSRLYLLMLTFLSLFSTVVNGDMGQAIPQVIEKDGACPGFYVANNNYCVPMNNAPFAIHKNGSCPSGYVSSGNYCEATNNARYVVNKNGPCPGGWVASGNYCMRIDR